MWSALKLSPRSSPISRPRVYGCGLPLVVPGCSMTRSRESATSPGCERTLCAVVSGAMNKNLQAGLGALMVLVGLLWTLQGLGKVGGSPMTGVTLWSVIGPIAVSYTH